jgi:hypothetical protein
MTGELAPQSGAAFTLHSDRVSITVELDEGGRKPTGITYEDGTCVQSFTGNQITVEWTMLGLLATFTLIPAINADRRLFTLILPAPQLEHPGYRVGSTMGIISTQLKTDFGSQFTYEHMDLS